MNHKLQSILMLGAMACLATHIFAAQWQKADRPGAMHHAANAAQPRMLDALPRMESCSSDIKSESTSDFDISRRAVAVGKFSLQPSDLIDVREIRNSHRPLGAAQIFAGKSAGPGQSAPRIVVKPLEFKGIERTADSSSAGRALIQDSSTGLK